ncbi:MAG: ATP-binding cassette domain-containing protein, partial [Eudoraea sp.]|nr:ATP-binding cassette domain-containing protein [Eudoraea sp.]
MKSTLEIHNLSIGYPGKHREKHVVVSDLNLSLQQGEFTAIIGINGIGKSTLLRTLGGVQDKLGGTILINGEPLESLSGQALATEMSIVLT